MSMTLELYLERVEGAGIGRRFLASGFPSEVTEDMKAPRENDALKPVGVRVCPYVLEDLSAMNGPRWLRATVTGAMAGRAVQQRQRGKRTTGAERHE